MTAAFAVVLAATMPMAYAQTTQNAPATTGETGAASPGATVTTPGNMPATGNEAASGTANEAGGAANRQAEVHLGQGQMLFSKMNGAAVYDEQNKQIGDISNVVLDPNGQVAAVLIKSGGFLGLGGKVFAVPMNAIKLSNANNGNLRFQLAMTQEQVKTAPTYDLNPQSTATGSSNAPAGEGNAGAGSGGNGSNR